MAKTRIKDQIIEIPEGVSVKYESNYLIVEGKEGVNKRLLYDPLIDITIEDKKIVLKAKRHTKREKTKIGTFKAHIKNLIKGVNEKFEYKLKICSGHFPMNVSISGNEFIVKNFLGEKVPRKLKIKEGAEVKIDGQIITVKSTNKEIAGQVAADIEQLCRITNRDRRRFQDGIYIINKAGKEIV